VVVEVIARHQPVGGQKPNPGAPTQFSGMRPGKELLAFTMRAGPRDRQHRGYFVGVEIVPANRKVTNARRSASASVFIVEVAKRLALRIGYGTIAAYDDAIHVGKVVRRLDLVKRG
jgi:hypothetical protein